MENKNITERIKELDTNNIFKQVLGGSTPETIFIEIDDSFRIFYTIKNSQIGMTINKVLCNEITQSRAEYFDYSINAITFFKENKEKIRQIIKECIND